MKIVTVVGARPQFIKLAPVSKLLRIKGHEVIVNTGQHYDYNMSEVFFQELDIPRPDYDLRVGSGTHGKQTGEMLAKIEEVLCKEQPDAVLVYGDTNSTLAGALAASKLHIKLIHVEAGLRSFNRRMPEEINRRLTDHISDFLFAPTESAVNNLRRENIVDKVYNVGDVMLDAVLHCRQNLVADRSKGRNPYYLATIHRAESTDHPQTLRAILATLRGLDLEVVLPLHPRTKAKIAEHGLHLWLDSPNLHVMEPLPYLQMLGLESHAKAIITDSGGIQKEAYFLKVPCFTLRTETEWTETVDSGWNTLLAPDRDHSETIMMKPTRPADHPEYFGNGTAAEQIVRVLEEQLGQI